MHAATISNDKPCSPSWTLAPLETSRNCKMKVHIKSLVIWQWICHIQHFCVVHIHQMLLGCIYTGYRTSDVQKTHKLHIYVELKVGRRKVYSVVLNAQGLTVANENTISLSRQIEHSAQYCDIWFLVKFWQPSPADRGHRAFPSLLVVPVLPAFLPHSQWTTHPAQRRKHRAVSEQRVKNWTRLDALR